MSGNVFYHCSFCKTYFHRDRYVTHISINHRHQRFFRVYCGKDGCGLSFSSVKTLTRHIKLKHDPLAATIEYGGANSGEEMEDRQPDPKREEAEFLLKLADRGKLSENATDEVIEHTRHLLGQRVATLKTKLERRILESSGTPATVMMPEWENMFATNSLFGELDTKHLQTKFYTKEFNLVEATPITLGAEMIWSNGKLISKPHICYVIDFLSELQNYLNNPGVMQHILERSPNADDKYQDMFDGEAFQHHPVFRDDVHALQVIAYQDDLEVVNPLGSKVKIHKIAAFYWYLANVDPKYRSSTRHIHLMCLALTKDVKKYGIKNMVSNFITGVNKLAEGHLLKIRDTERLVNGALLAVIGDTLSSNFLSGFKESVAFAERKCRTCLCPNSDMKSKFSEEDFVSRDLAQHLHHCELLANSETQEERRHWSKIYGVTRLSEFNQVLGFNICKEFPHDVMHVLLEGVVPREVKLLINFCIEHNYFTLSRLNSRLKCFCYGYSQKKNKPTSIDKKHLQSQDMKLRQSAVQMLLLTEILPFVIGSYVPHGDNHWKSFLLLRQILRLCTSFTLETSHINMLRLLIKEHHQLYVELYGEGQFMPKHHYMVHLPMQILRFGPPRHHWCLRLEAKHNFFKNEVTGNFKNITKSLSMRHQLWMCSNLLPGNSESFLYAGHQLLGGKVIVIAESEYRIALERKLQEIGETEVNFLKLNSAVMYGQVYRSGGYVLYQEEDDEGFPLFAHICQVVSLCGTLFAVVTLMDTHSHDNHYDAYRIEKILAGEYTCVKLCNIQHHKVLHAHMVDDHLYISTNQLPIVDLL